MRKTIVAALVTLLVVLAVSCGDFLTVPEGEKPEYTADGKKLVNLKVKIGGSANSRALSDTLAKAEANYIEVIFKSGNDYFQTDGLRDQVLSLRLPADDYDETNSILLVGNKSSGDIYTLLAVGTPKDDSGQLKGKSGNTFTIEFGVTSLTADLYAGGTPTFSITSDFSSGTGGLNKPAFVGQTKDGTFHDGLTTCFQVPTSISSATPITAKLEIHGFGATTTGTTGTIVSAGDNAVTFTEVGNNLIGDDIDPTDITFGIASGTGTIGFSFETGANKANYVITFDIPVVGLAASGTGLENAKTWHINGGTKPGIRNYQNATGGGQEGVALLVTPSPYKLVNISVNPVWPTTP